MGRQEVVPFLFEVYIIFAGESFAEKKLGKVCPHMRTTLQNDEAMMTLFISTFASIVFVWVHHALAPATVCRVYSNK